MTTMKVSKKYKVEIDEIKEFLAGKYGIRMKKVSVIHGVGVNESVQLKSIEFTYDEEPEILGALPRQAP